MVLVNEDIKNNKELYDIDAVDKNIDFRRVKNLKSSRCSSISSS